MPFIDSFASFNTTLGFQNHFESILREDQLQKLYIIKGGPGTGKSHLMKAIAAAWDKDGATVERFFCSSDPDSLDGILHPQRGIAVMDGTAPHSRESSFPGCVGVLVHTGEFWNEGLLENRRDEILSLSRQKAEAYTAAYAYLRAAGQMAEERRRLAAQDINRDKLYGAARRFLERELSGRGQGQRQLRLTQSYGKKGLLSLRSFESSAQRRCLVCDRFGLGSLFLEFLKTQAKEDCLCSYSPRFPKDLNALSFPRQGLCVVCEEKERWEQEFSQADRYFNMERFLSPQVLRANRQKLRFAAKCQGVLEEGATQAFQKAAAFHAQLEKIYSSAMDFSALSQKEEELIAKLS